MKSEQIEQTENLVHALADFVNTYNNKEKTELFIKLFANEHRTLQQSIFKLFLQTIEFMATDEYRTDGRNEDSKQIAQDLLDGFQQVKDIRGYKPSEFLRFI